MTEAFTREGAVSWIKHYGNWAWLAGLFLLVGDLVLPVPGTAVIAALGFVYGPVWGGLIGGCGSFLSGSVAFGLCRSMGRRAAVKILGEHDLRKGERLFSSAGGWLVVLSRWLPLFPEVIACMAGLTRMSPRTFHAAMACGSLPMGFIFATIGHAGVDKPALALVLSAALPPIIWFSVRPLFQAFSLSDNDSSSQG